MGKSGDALRQKKAEKVLYHFTREEMEKHDSLVRQTCKERIMAQCKAEAQIEYEKQQEELTKKIEEEWNKRAEEFRNPDAESDFQVWMVHFLSLGSRILIEKFNWLPPKPNDKRYRIVRFINYFIDELNAIGKDELRDIRQSTDEVAKLYGIQFMRQDEEEDHDGEAGESKEVAV